MRCAAAAACSSSSGQEHLQQLLQWPPPHCMHVSRLKGESGDSSRHQCQLSRCTEGRNTTPHLAQLSPLLAALLIAHRRLIFVLGALPVLKRT